MSRHFCCCIPVRVAVFVSSLLAFLFSGLITAVSVYVLIKTSDENDPRFSNLTSQQRTVFIVVACVYALIALMSLFGFIGSIIRKRSFVAAYSFMTIVILLIQTAADVYSTYALFHGDIKLRCTTDPNTDPGTCQDVLRHSRPFYVAFVVIVWLIQLYVVVVIRRYVKQLDEEQLYKHTSAHHNAAFNMTPSANVQYHPVGHPDPKGHYPYSDPHHSFGPHV